MTKLVVIVGFLVSFAAGVMVGISAQRRSMIDATSAGATTRPSSRGGWIASELNLSPQQQEQLKQIWSEAAGQGRGDHDDRRRQLRRERDEGIAALIHEEDQARYDAVMKNYTDQLDAMDAQVKERFADAVRRTKEVLTPQQREKYEEILKRRSWGRDRDTTRRSVGGATSRPSQP